MERGLVCTLNVASLIGVEQTTCAWCCGGRLVLFHRRQSCRAGTCTLVLFAGGGLRTGTSRWTDSFTLGCDQQMRYPFDQVKQSPAFKRSGCIEAFTFERTQRGARGKGPAGIIQHDASRNCAKSDRIIGRVHRSGTAANETNIGTPSVTKCQGGPG